MIIPSVLLLLLTLLTFNRANEQPPIGIINHNTTWSMHCADDNIQTIHPPLDDRATVPYQCPDPSFSLDILPIEIDFTFVCRSPSRLVWIIVDLYQYQTWPMSMDPQRLNISLTINQQMPLRDHKSEVNQYESRFILTNAFYIPFESLDTLADRPIEILVQINHCQFSLRSNSTWDDVVRKNCDSIESKALQVQSGQCHFLPKWKPPDVRDDQNVQPLEDVTTEIPDFHVILSVDQQRAMETTTTSPLQDHERFIDAHYRNIFLTIRGTAHLIMYIFIFTAMILLLLIIFFLYILCYHFHTRAARRSSLLI